MLASALLRDHPASRDELFVQGANHLFGPPVYMRARFFLPWVHSTTLAGEPPRLRLLVLVARLSGMVAVAAFVAALIFLARSQGA
jgi:hypothetical protein